jgi:hypothetical protein
MKLDVGPAITVPAWVILHPELTPTAVRLYCLLACRLAMYGEGDQPTRRIMGADLGGVSKESVKRALRLLEQAGALTITYISGQVSEYTVNLACARPTSLGHVYPEGLDRAAQSAPGLMAVQTGHQPLQAPTYGGVRDDHTTRVRSSTDLRSIEQKDSRLSDADYVRKLTMPRFDDIWGEWPIQAGRYQARLRWWRLGVETDDHLWADLRNGITRWLDYWTTTGMKRSHIPYLNTWLERRGWEDSPVADADNDPRRAVAYLKELDSE